MEVGPQATGIFDEAEHLVGIVDRHDQHARLADPGGLEQVRPGGVAVEGADAELAQVVHQLGLMVEDDGLDAVGKQQPVDDLAEAAMAGDDDIALVGDRVGLALDGQGLPGAITRS